MFRGKLKSKTRPLAYALPACLVGVGLSYGPGMALAAQLPSEGSVIILLDSSGSMKEPAGNGKTRMEAAKIGLAKVIEALPAGAKVGLRVYGASVEDGPKSCQDSDLLVPVEDVDKAKLTAGVKKMKPLGNTPIAYSLKEAARDLPKDGTRSIVLVSDGQENCNGNPCKVAKEISDSGTKLHVDVIGLQVDTKSRNQLTCIASAGGGTYYDVPDVTSLPKTLTRVSVRGARGYEPAGKPVEGGTSADDAVEIADGQWLDTIGDSDTENYKILDPGTGTLHVAATLRPVGLGTADGAEIGVDVLSASGRACGPGVRAHAIGAFTASAPITATYTLTADDRKDCGKGPYTLAVSAPDLNDVKPLEVLVSSEAAVKATEGLPAAAEDADFVAEGAPPAGNAIPVFGSPSFSGAPLLEPGTYTDSILGAETLFYSANVDWGQQLACEATIGANPRAKVYGNPSVSVQAYGFQRGRIAQPSDATDQDFYNGKKNVTVKATTPPVRYLNRESYQDSVSSASMSGTYYCAVFVNAGKNQIAGLGELPVTLRVSTVGTAGEGKPDYLAKLANAKNSDDKNADADGGMGVGAFAAAGAAILALLALIWAFLRRRRSTA